jgi:hypothetical protein
MAVYKIFPEKSTTLYSFYPTKNTGLDEILELSNYLSINSTSETSRILLKFPNNEINDVITNLVSGSNYDAYIKLYLANASSIPVNYTIYSHPISGSWENGTGRLGNVPEVTDGASWEYRNSDNGSSWFSVSFPPLTTGSYSGNIGGGLWYTSSFYEATQSFNLSSTKDIELKVSNTVKGWVSSSINNEGFIIKHSSALEFNSQSYFETKYFSSNTHTIYPPCLEIRWDDSLYITGSQPQVDSDLYTISLGNNKNEFQQDSVQRFRIKVRPKYPPRTYSTSSFSFNLVNYVLPISSYWSIKDLDTEEIIVDYDKNYTKISCDTNGNYFNLYVNGLEPERYYKLLFKSVLSNGETLVLDNNYYFKVIR